MSDHSPAPIPGPPPLPPVTSRPPAVEAAGGPAYPLWRRLAVIFAPLVALGLAYGTGITGRRGGVEPTNRAALPIPLPRISVTPPPAEAPLTAVPPPPVAIATPTVVPPPPAAVAPPPKPTPAPAKTAAESYQRARAKHPALNYPATPFYQQFTAEMGRLKAARDPLLDNPSFPEIVADRLGEQLVKH